jgi:GrpB-like predicted nucleotidyltransferase (UPF0157 family)
MAPLMVMGRKETTAPVVIVDYDPQWPILYEEEKGRILGVIGHAVVAIEHVGSTAVPGLGAKPTIDIIVGIRQLADAEECIELLRSIGYEYVPEYNDIIPERRYFHKGPPEARTQHLHMVEVTSDFWERHVLFRDYLRTHPEEARRYHKLKKELSAEFGSDREGYTDAKTAFIGAAVAKAQAEKAKEV